MTKSHSGFSMTTRAPGLVSYPASSPGEQTSSWTIGQYPCITPPARQPSGCWDPITLRADVQRYYQHVRTALASGGDWSVLSVMQFHCALLIKMLLLHPDMRRAALDPDTDLSGAKTDQMVVTLLSMHHRALCSPAPILSGQPDMADIVKLLRTLDAIVRSWTLAGPQSSAEVRFMIVVPHRLRMSARDLLHVAVELDCALASTIVAAQEARSAALSSAAT